MGTSSAPTEGLDKENIRAGYKAALDLWVYSGSHAWARFNVMLVAQGIVISALAVAASSKDPPRALLILPAIGLVMTWFWFALMKRSFDYERYYILCARELEGKLREKPSSSPADIVEVDIVSRGSRFSEGEMVEFNISGQRRFLQMGCWSRVLRARGVSYLLIVVFAIVHLLSLLYILTTVKFA